MRSRSGLFDASVTVYFFFLLVFLISRTSNFTSPHDSMAYLEMLRTKNHLWHPHHLLYHELSYYWLHLWKGIFPRVDDYLLVESLSCVFGAGTIAIVFRFFRNRFDLPLLTSWVAAGIVAFSYGVWFYSINVEVYAPSIFFTIACLHQLTKKEWEAKAVWLTVIFHSLAILFHQMNILMAPVVIYKIFEQRKNIFVFKTIFWYAFSGIVLVGGTYLLAGRVGEGHYDFKSWMQWLEGYTATNEYWRPLTLKTPFLAATGFGHAIIGGHFIFNMGLDKLFSSLLGAHSLSDEYFLVKNMPKGIGISLFILCVLFVIGTLVLLIKFISRFKSINKQYFYIIVPLILYIVVYSVYFLFWMPEILEFWIGQSIAFWLLLIGTYEPVNRRFNLLLSSMLVLIVAVNYGGSIRPMQNINNDIGYVRVQKVREMATSSDLVVVQDPWLLKEFLEYYTPATIVTSPTDQPQNDSLQTEIRNRLQQGHKIFVFPDPKTAGNNDFTHTLINEYNGRSTVIQKDPAEVYMIK